jgi:hypothetical protein
MTDGYALPPLGSAMGDPSDHRPSTTPCGRLA